MTSGQIIIQTCLKYNILQTVLHFPALNFQSLAMVSMGRHKTAFVIRPKSSWEQITNIGNPKKDAAADHYWISKSASFPRIPTAECFHRQNFRRSRARIEGNRLLHIGTILETPKPPVDPDWLRHIRSNRNVWIITHPSHKFCLILSLWLTLFLLVLKT